jgi:hypothetical protein
MDVTASQTTIKNVMDLYYSWLISMIGPKGKDKIALLSTIVTHDVTKEAPLYTNYVYRQFADRTISISPEDFGPGNTNDRYSRVYRGIIEIAASDLYANANLTVDQQNLIDRWRGDVTAAITEIKNIRHISLKDWSDYAQQAGLHPGTPAYDLERAKFYQPYIALIKDQRQKIVVAQSKVRAIYLSVFKNDKPAQQLADVYERTIAEDSQQALPRYIDIEPKYKLDPITIGSAADAGLDGFEKELGLFPSGTLTRILDMEGVRGEEFIKDVKETHNHDSEWHASASGGWGLWHANANASQEQHFRQSLSHLESISISCDFMGEYWVNRKDWFSSNILENKYVLPVLKLDSRAAAQLANCISSLIIVRGLKVKYKFKDVNDTAVWSSYSYSGGGGYGAFGIDFGSVGGGASGSKYDHVIDTTEKSVTLSDGSDVCRLLALRVSSLIDMSPEQIAFEMKPLGDSVWGREVIGAWQSGAVPFGTLPSAISKLVVRE